MVQNTVTCPTAPTTCSKNSKKLFKNTKPSKGALKLESSETSQNQVNGSASSVAENAARKDDTKDMQEKVRPLTAALEEIKQRRREELLTKRQQAQMEREEFVREMTEKKTMERAEIIKEARRLILYKKPLCRRINRALLVSECYKELDAQVAFKKTIEEVDRQAQIKYEYSIKADVAKFEEEEKQRKTDLLEKRKNYAEELKKQIEEVETAAKTKQEEEFEADKEDQINMRRYMQLIKEQEAEQVQNKKKKMQQFFKDAIEEKNQFDRELKHSEEFEDRALGIYRNAKIRVQKMHKDLAIKEKEERERRAQVIAKKHSDLMHSREAEEEAIWKRAVKEQEAAEQEKQRAREDRENATRGAMQYYKVEMAAAKAKQIQEENDIKAWETMLRFKRDEYNKGVEFDRRKQKWDKRMEYASVLEGNITERRAERQREKAEDEKVTDITTIVEKENQKILNYAKEVVKESTGLRPLYPILKAIEECKKEMGLVPLREAKDILPETKPKRTRGLPTSCTKFVPEEKILIL